MPPGSCRRDLNRTSSGQGQPHCAGLVLATHRQPDFFSRVDCFEREADAEWGWLGGVSNAHHRDISCSDACHFGEQRRNMCIRSHTEQQDVETGQAGIPEFNGFGIRCGLQAGSVVRGSFVLRTEIITGPELVDAVLRNIEVVQQGFLRLHGITVCVCLGEKPLIPPPEVNLGPVDGGARRRLGNRTQCRSAQ